MGQFRESGDETKIVAAKRKLCFPVADGHSLCRFFGMPPLLSCRGQTLRLPAIFGQLQSVAPTLPSLLFGRPQSIAPTLMQSQGSTTINKSFSVMVGSCPFPDFLSYLTDYQNLSVSISNQLLPSPFLSFCEFHQLPISL